MVEKRPKSSRESSYEQGTQETSRRGLRSLVRTVSPPRKTSKKQKREEARSVAADIEAGHHHVTDQVAFYSSHLQKSIQSLLPGEPRINHEEWIALFKRNAGSPEGRHFVVHQHDHPVAGTHYDLRLQCNPTSSISFAIMYGLPGDPNSRRLNRNATETRVHCLWNHLIETASHTTGSILIWDTGEYEVLPYDMDGGYETEDDEEIVSGAIMHTQQQKLRDAFQRRKVKLMLHGTRLPHGYTISLRLTKENHRGEQPGRPSRKRRRKVPVGVQARLADDTDDESAVSVHNPIAGALSSLKTSSASPHDSAAEITTKEDAAAVASDDGDETIRANNAYIGATNDIGSIHQRRWFLSLDRRASGFVRRTRKSLSEGDRASWDRIVDDKLANGLIGGVSGFERFVVGGRDSERSVVTGRLAKQILADEGVVNYVPRGLWRPVIE